MVSEANEPGSESGKRSDDRRGAARGTRAGSWPPQEGGASSHLAARLPPRSPGSFAAAAMITGWPPLDLQRADARLPVPPVERLRRERGEVHAIEAADVHVDAIGVGARHVEARHAAVPAEEMARRHGAEPVARELRLAGEQAEAVARHDQVEVGLLRADEAVALTHARQVGRHLVAH